MLFSIIITIIYLFLLSNKIKKNRVNKKINENSSNNYNYFKN